MIILVRPALFVLVAMLGISAWAQAPSPTAVGALGQRYAEIAIGQVDVGDDLFDRGDIAAVNLNIPTWRTVDLSFGGSLRKLRGSTVAGLLAPSAEVTSRGRAAFATATAYLRRTAVAPFVRATAGMEWMDQERVWRSGRFGPGRTERHDRYGMWRVGAGAELLVKRVAVTPILEYQDKYRDVFGSEIGHAWTYGLTAHLWFTKMIGGFAHVAYIRPSREYSYRTQLGDIGLRVRF